MTATNAVGDGAKTHLECGCCGRTLPVARLTELGRTPGVYICAGCARWAARRASRRPNLRWTSRALLELTRSRPGRGRRHEHMMRSAIPILTSGDLDRTATFWRPVGFDVVERHADYLVTHAYGVELHFAHDPSRQSYSATGTSSALAFIHVQDAAALWKRLKAARTTGLGPVEDQDHGLREFILTDPDGNQVRFGSAIRT